MPHMSPRVPGLHRHALSASIRRPSPHRTSPDRLGHHALRHLANSQLDAIETLEALLLEEQTLLVRERFGGEAPVDVALHDRAPLPAGLPGVDPHLDRP